MKALTLFLNNSIGISLELSIIAHHRYAFERSLQGTGQNLGLIYYLYARLFFPSNILCLVRQYFVQLRRVMIFHQQK